MGEHHQTQHEPDDVRLQREAQELLGQLRAKLNELDRVRAAKRGRHLDPEQRRRAFRVIQGGAAAIIGLAVGWVWHAARRPIVAVGAGTGAVATGMFIATPMVEPGTAAEPPPEVVVATRPSPTVREREPQSAPAAANPAVRPSPVSQEALEPAPLPETQFTPTPSPAPTPTPTPAPPAKVEVEVDAGLDDGLSAEAQLCLDVGLSPLANVEACVERAEKLGLDVDAELADELGLDLLGR